MTMTEPNPREAIGGNSPDYAREVSDQLKRDYAGTEASVAALLEEARALPKEITDDASMGIFARIIKRCRDLTGQIDAYHTKEKEPHLRRGQAVDQHFKVLSSKLMQAKKTDPKGAADVLQDRIDRFMDEKEAAERRIREEAERKAREEADRLAAIQRENDLKAQEAAAKAARARNEETIAANKLKAEEAERLAAASRAESEAANARLQEAHEQATAKPADLTRTRLADGVLVTQKREWVYSLEDSSKLDAAALWPFVKEDAKLAAFTAWSKTTQHKNPMNGGTFRQRTTAPVR